MLFTSAEDFLNQASAVPQLSRAEQKELAQRMAAGDLSAREVLVKSQFPLVASHIRRAPGRIRTLHTVYACIAVVEKSVDRFNFQQDSESFAHHLGWGLRQCIIRCLVDSDRTAE